jgi:hypothetical protein
MLQRATFWNKMDAHHKWHVLFEEPRVLPTIDVPVEPDVGELVQVGSTPDTLIGNLRFGEIDAIIHTILQFIPINNVVPVWTYPPLNATCSDNNLLEVGDPQGNGPQFALFPTVVIPLRG